MAADVLISHAEQDREVARTLAQALRQEGWSAGSDAYCDSIELRRARCVIVLWSNKALDDTRFTRVVREVDQHVLISVAIERLIGSPPLPSEIPLLEWDGDVTAPGYVQIRRATATIVDLTRRLPPQAPNASARLILEIVNANGDVPGDLRSKAIGPEGAQIGRSKESDWVINDPYVSRIHARVRFVNGSYYVEGTGRSPLALSDPSNVVPNNQPQLLGNGDRFFLDQYEIRATVDTAAERKPPPMAPFAQESDSPTVCVPPVVPVVPPQQPWHPAEAHPNDIRVPNADDAVGLDPLDLLDGKRNAPPPPVRPINLEQGPVIENQFSPPQPLPRPLNANEPTPHLGSAMPQPESFIHKQARTPGSVNQQSPSERRDQEQPEPRIDPFGRLEVRPAAAKRPESRVNPVVDKTLHRVIPSPAHAQEAPITDNVHFSITAPAMVAPGTSFLFDVWAHLERHQPELLRRALEQLGTRKLAIRSLGPEPITRDSTIQVLVSIPEFALQDAAELHWTGTISNVSFMAAVPERTTHGLHPGIVKLLIGSIPIARLHFSVLVGSRSTEVEDRTQRLERAKNAFASYATEDRNGVLARIQGMQKLLPSLDVFLDAVSLRSGESWAQRLEDEIASRDTFYLFWSRSARESKWVEHEWRFALERKGLQFIDPVPLESAKLAPPPPELASLHFNDWVLFASPTREDQRTRAETGQL